MAHIYFTDFFEVSPRDLDDYGAFNVSLVSDLPLFVDPFLLFNSDDPTYQELHHGIIEYVRFLRDRSADLRLDPGLLKAWYYFGEVKQNWLGYSKRGNSGSGLGRKFAGALHQNLHSVFYDFGAEKVTRGSHLEKLCLIAPGVGRDNISDFTTNLIKDFLLEYTQAFAIQFIRPELRKTFMVDRVCFNYWTETWERRRYELPYLNGDYVLLTPKDILTRDEIWISREGLFHQFDQIASSIPNDILRSQINNYFRAQLAPNADKKEVNRAVERVVREYPEILEYYIRDREDEGDAATSVSQERVSRSTQLFVNQVREFVTKSLEGTYFYDVAGDTYEEARSRLMYLKHTIEHNDGYRIFYVNGQPIEREADLQILYRLTWYATPLDVNREVNNGRGPVDFKVSRGSHDSSLIEFKLATNSQLKRNLENQVDVYERANATNKSLKAIVYFSHDDLKRVQRILQELDLENSPDIVLIDARSDNKPSASKT